MEDINKINSKNTYLLEKPSVISLLEFINKTEEVIDVLSMNLWCIFQVGIDISYWIAFQDLFESCNRVLCSIKECIKIGNFPDAIMLTRKYRDDIIFYFYSALNASDYITSTIEETKPDKEKRKRIDQWMRNKRDHFSVSNAVDNEFSKDERLKEFFIKFNIPKQCEEFNTKLNRFVHSKGFAYINHPALFYQRNPQVLEEMCAIIKNAIQFFSVLFIALESIINPCSVASSDYVDSLDNGLEPEVGSQYWVAPIIKTYFKENGKILGDGLIDYMKSFTSMEFE